MLSCVLGFVVCGFFFFSVAARHRIAGAIPKGKRKPSEILEVSSWVRPTGRITSAEMRRDRTRTRDPRRRRAESPGRWVGKPRRSPEARIWLRGNVRLGCVVAVCIVHLKL